MGHAGDSQPPKIVGLPHDHTEGGLELMTQNLNLCGLVNPDDYLDSEWLSIHKKLESYSSAKHVFFHTNGKNVYRKGWEWTRTIFGLKRLGMINGNHSALGVGCGRECVIFYLADNLNSVVATDLYGNETWTSNFGKEADPVMLTNPEQCCPRNYRRDRLQVLNMNGTELKFESGIFDICWSLSSIEHFGGHDMARKAMREMGRVTRTGGIVVIATEYLLLEEYSHPEYFRKKEILDVIVNSCDELELVAPIDFSLPPLEYLIDQICFKSDGVHRVRRHVVLNDGNCQWTSIIMFFRKK